MTALIPDFGDQICRECGCSDAEWGWVSWATRDLCSDCADDGEEDA